MTSSETPVNTEKYGKKLEFDPEFRGPIDSRSCTDVICLCLFVAFLAGWAVVAFFAYREGDPKILLYPTDSQGNICGIGKFENKKYLYFFDFLKCASPSVIFSGCPTPQVCVAKCPNETFHVMKYASKLDELKDKLICKDDAINTTEKLQDIMSLMEKGDCAVMYFKSTPILNRCLPDIFIKPESEVKLNDSSEIRKRVKEDNPSLDKQLKDEEKLQENPEFKKRLKDNPEIEANSELEGNVKEEIKKQLKDPNIDVVVKDKENKDVTVDNKKVTLKWIQKAVGTLVKFLSLREFGEDIFADFKSSWQYILVGLLISMVLSFIWIILMRWFAGIMVWVSVAVVLVFLAFACYYSTSKYIELKNAPGSDAKLRFTLNIKSYLALRDTWLVFAITTGVLFTVLLVLIIFLRKRIFIAVALIKEASRAVSCMVFSLLIPLVSYTLLITFFVFWVTLSLYVASSGKASYVIANAPLDSGLKNGSLCNPKKFENDTSGVKCLFLSYGLRENIYSAHAYNLFGLFWGSFFAIGVGHLTLAGVFASYYWTLNKKNVPSFAVSVSFYRCVRYHLGSIAFGSMLIASIRFIRVTLEFVDRNLRKYDNKVTKFLLWCCKCCFWCLEIIMRLVSKNAYIMIAIYGKNFCTSARKAFMLLMRNIIRVAVVTKITDFLLFLGKLVVVAVAACLSFYLFATSQTLYTNLPQLNYYLVPPIFITVGSYLIASGFFSVYAMAIDTLFLCFLEDSERNDGTPEKPYYMSKELMKILDKKNKYRDVESSK